MPSAITPRPTSADVPTAQLECISLSKLLQNDATETELLFQKCKNPGTFLLDFRGSAQGEELLQEKDEVLGLFGRFFNQEMEEKIKFPMDRNTASGYKPVGATKVDENGTPDSNEFYTVTRLDVTEDTGILMPESIYEKRPFLEQFMSHTHQVVLDLLDSLDGHLHIPRGTLAEKHAQEQPSSSQVRVIKYNAQPHSERRVIFPKHTDLGTFTVLFATLGGLQILPQDAANVEENWLFVYPKEGCAIVNVGDTLQKYTNGLFMSPIHRVASPPGEQAGQTRFSIAYFSRPAQTALMKRLDSDVVPKPAAGEVQEEMTVMEWYWREFLAKQKKHNITALGGQS